jgi:ribosomal protein L37AE/L43A
VSVRNRLERLEQFRRDDPPTCPTCGQRVYAVDRPAPGEPAKCIHCGGTLAELPAGVVVKEYQGVSFTDL